MYYMNQVHAEWDIWWHDLWTFPLYTRGGPYWQEYRVPFSKFYFAHKGKIQDDQVRQIYTMTICVRGQTQSILILDCSEV